MNIKTKNCIDVQEWDELVRTTYGKPYNFQQQDGCQSRGTFHLTVPSPDACDDEMHDSIEETLNRDDMGVKFNVWLERDPKQPLPNYTDQWAIDMFWDRNFYPDIHTVANDLHAKGLLEAGEYVIEIDW